MNESLFQLETPCFVFDETELADNFHDFARALHAHWSPASEVAYSIKTNPLPWILRTARTCGCMAEAVSDEEYEFGARMRIRTAAHRLQRAHQGTGALRIGA